MEMVLAMVMVMVMVMVTGGMRQTMTWAGGGLLDMDQLVTRHQQLLDSAENRPVAPGTG